LLLHAERLSFRFADHDVVFESTCPPIFETVQARFN
jgi:hypothetical protein